MNAVTHDRYYLASYDRTFEAFDEYLSAQKTWFATQHEEKRGKTIAYFSMEFGLHETVPLYAGGLGVLSGDHLKEASDLGLPLVGIGFLYTRGYFSQRITEDGWQEVRDYEMNLDDAPLVQVLDDKGKPSHHICLASGAGTFRPVLGNPGGAGPADPVGF